MIRRIMWDRENKFYRVYQDGVELGTCPTLDEVDSLYAQQVQAETTPSALKANGTEGPARSDD